MKEEKMIRQWKESKLNTKWEGKLESNEKKTKK